VYTSHPCSELQSRSNVRYTDFRACTWEWNAVSPAINRGGSDVPCRQVTPLLAPSHVAIDVQHSTLVPLAHITFVIHDSCNTITFALPIQRGIFATSTEIYELDVLMRN